MGMDESYWDSRTETVWEWTEAGGTFYTCVRISLKGKPADSARGLAVSNLRERQMVHKQNFFFNLQRWQRSEKNITVNSRALLSILNSWLIIVALIKLMGLTISFENDKIENWPFLDILERLELHMPRALEIQKKFYNTLKWISRVYTFHALGRCKKRLFRNLVTEKWDQL